MAQNPPPPLGRIGAGPNRSEADRQAVQRLAPHQRQHLAGAADILRQPSAHEKAARILPNIRPCADRLTRIVLEQHADAARTAAFQ